MKKIISLILISVFFFTCSSNEELLKLNENTKRPLTVSSETLVTNAQWYLGRQFSNNDVNSGIFRLLVQYLTEVTYTAETNYDYASRHIPENNWNRMYRDILNYLKDAQKLLITEANENKKVEQASQGAIIEVLSVLTWSTLVNMYGDIPYKEALNTEVLQPKYDTASEIYVDLFTRLNAAITTLNAGKGTASMTSTQDMIYGGDTAKWYKLANSLKLRMAVVTNNQAEAEAAVPNVFTTRADGAYVKYQSTSPNQNPLYEDLTASGRKDFVASKFFMDELNRLNDPRRKQYFTPVSGEFKGGITGALNAYDDFSHINDKIGGVANLPGELFSYTEVEFLLAQVAQNGWNAGGGTAELHYTNGITESILYWGGTSGEVVAYLSQSSVLPYTLEKLGTQKWIALFINPIPAWTTMRLLDLPKVLVPASPTSGFPQRLTYPAAEQTLNPKGYNSVKDKDKVESKIFWDTVDYQYKS